MPVTDQDKEQNNAITKEELPIDFCIWSATNPQIQDNAITKTKIDDLFIDFVSYGWPIMIMFFYTFANATG